MKYAIFSDVQERCRRSLEKDSDLCEALLEDSAVIIDAYNESAPPDAKRLVSCNMVIRAIGDGEISQVPIGATQGTVSALGYSQTWAMPNGSARELYLSKLDKKILGAGRKICFQSPIEAAQEETR